MASETHLISRLPLQSRSSSVSAKYKNSTLRVGKRPTVFPLCYEDDGSRVAGSKAFLVRRIYCYGQVGDSFGMRMNLFNRFLRVIKSYANAILSIFESPEKVLEQTIIEMNDDLIKMRQAAAQVLASQKRLENKYKAIQQASVDWNHRAELALQKGDEDLAREALKRRNSCSSNENALARQLGQQKSIIEKLISNTKFLESKIQEAKSKKDTLIARSYSAKALRNVNEVLGNINTSNALAAFEKMEEKVSVMESMAESLGQLSTDEMDKKFALLESSSVDDDLQILKNKLHNKRYKLKELPAPRIGVSVANQSFLGQDVEIETQLVELGHEKEHMG